MIDNRLLEKLKGKTVFITGATGLIGRCMIHMLLDSLNDIIIVALVRSIDKVQKLFEPYISDSRMKIIVGDVIDFPAVEFDIDYIVHAAGQTASLAFVNQPVETSLTALQGTINLLELAKVKHISGFVFLSSMEVYGTPRDDKKISENYLGNLNHMDVRSCYPESKRMCENLCASYVSEYEIPAMVVRLTQTFGPGVQYNDARVFAEFARCAIEKKNIILHSNGETKRSYLYTEDAVRAILTVMLYGTPGEVYNAANEDTYCSIYEMAELVASMDLGKGISIFVENDSKEKERYGYASTLHMNLDSTKLRELGWSARVGLEEMFQNMIKDMSKLFY